MIYKYTVYISIKNKPHNIMTTDNQGIYDARELGKPKFVVLGIQHLFAMFGATILVPLINRIQEEISHP